MEYAKDCTSNWALKQNLCKNQQPQLKGVMLTSKTDLMHITNQTGRAHG